MESTDTLDSTSLTYTKEMPSVDLYAAKIVFSCNMNQALFIWESLLDQRLKTLPKATKKVGRLIENALQLMNSRPDKLRQSLLFYCANSVGFLQILIRISMNVLLGK